MCCFFVFFYRLVDRLHDGCLLYKESSDPILSVLIDSTYFIPAGVKLDIIISSIILVLP